MPKLNKSKTNELIATAKLMQETHGAWQCAETLCHQFKISPGYAHRLFKAHGLGFIDARKNRKKMSTADFVEKYKKILTRLVELSSTKSKMDACYAVGSEFDKSGEHIFQILQASGVKIDFIETTNNNEGTHLSSNKKRSKMVSGPAKSSLVLDDDFRNWDAYCEEIVQDLLDGLSPIDIVESRGLLSTDGVYETLFNDAQDIRLWMIARGYLDAQPKAIESEGVEAA